MLGKLRRELRGEVARLTPSQTLGEGSERGLGGLFCYWRDSIWPRVCTSLINSSYFT
jgi:hypothetical protein